jgi:hypothetical protein
MAVLSAVCWARSKGTAANIPAGGAVTSNRMICSKQGRQNSSEGEPFVEGVLWWLYCMEGVVDAKKGHKMQ